MQILPRSLTIRWAFRAFPRVFATVALASLGINVLMLTGAVYMLQIYDRVLPSGSVETLLLLSLIAVAMFIGLGALDIARNRLLSRLSMQMILKLREDVFRAMSRQALAQGPGRAMGLMKDLENVAGFFGSLGIAALFDVPMTIVFFIVIYLLHPLLLIYAVIAAVVLMALAIANHAWSRDSQQQAMKAHAALQEKLLAGLRNAEAVQALGMRENMLARWKQAQGAALWWGARARERIGSMGSLSRALRLMLQSGMLGLGAWLVLRGELGAGQMIVGSILLGRALQPVEQAITLWQGYQQYRLARGRLAKVLHDQQQAEQHLPRTPPEIHPRGQLSVRNLHVAAPGQRKPWLRGIGFDLPPGRIMVVLGETGSGKSMLARALAGLWPPLDGEILLDGADLRSWPEERLGRIIGFVPQDSQLVDASIAENIARMGTVDEQAVQKAAEQARAHEAIKAFGGYDRQVGPGGAYLPGGLRQRVALARALHGEPKLLILDEPDASLDRQGRKDLVEALLGMRQRGQSVILITHDASLQNVADFRLLLEQGRMKELSMRQQQPGIVSI